MRRLVFLASLLALAFITSVQPAQAVCVSTNISVDRSEYPKLVGPKAVFSYGGCEKGTNGVVVDYYRSDTGAAGSFSHFERLGNRPILEIPNDPWTLAGMSRAGYYYITATTTGPNTAGTPSAQSAVWRVLGDGGGTCTVTPGSTLPASGNLTVGQAYNWNVAGCAGLSYSVVFTGSVQTTGATSGNLPANNGTSGTFTPTTAGALTAVVSVNGNPIATYSWTVGPPPCTVTASGFLPASGALTVGQTYSVSATGCAGLGYSFVFSGSVTVNGAASGTLSAANSASATFTPTAQGVLSAVVLVNGVQVAAASWSVGPQPCTSPLSVYLPGGPYTQNVAVSFSVSGCAGTQFTFSVTGAIGGGTFIIPAGGTFYGSFTPTANGLLYVTVTGPSGQVFSNSYLVNPQGCTPGMTGFTFNLNAGPYVSGVAIGFTAYGCAGTAFTINLSGIGATGGGTFVIPGNPGTNGTYYGSLLPGSNGGLGVTVFVNNFQLYVTTITVNPPQPPATPVTISSFTLLDTFAVWPGPVRYAVNSSAPAGAAFAIELTNSAGGIVHDIAVGQNQNSFYLPAGVLAGRFGTQFKIAVSGQTPVRLADGQLDVTPAFSLGNQIDPSELRPVLRPTDVLIFNIDWDRIGSDMPVFADLERLAGNSREGVFERQIARGTATLPLSGLTPGTYYFRLYFDSFSPRLQTRELSFRIMAEDATNPSCTFTTRLDGKGGSAVFTANGYQVKKLPAGVYEASVFGFEGSPLPKINDGPSGFGTVYVNFFSESNSQGWLPTNLTNPGVQPVMSLVRTPACGWLAYAGEVLIEPNPDVKPDALSARLKLRIVAGSSTSRDGRAVVELVKDGNAYTGVGGVFAIYKGRHVLPFRFQSGQYVGFWPTDGEITLVGWEKENGFWSVAERLHIGRQ